MTTDGPTVTDSGTPEPRTGTAKPSFNERMEQFDAKNVVLVPILAVISALVVGALIVAATDIERLKTGDFGGIATNIVDAYKALFVGAFGSWSGISETLVFATPLMLTGLAVALSFRSGLFNIGATGQLLMGGMAAVYVGFSMHGPGILQIPLAMLAGVVAGGIWGGIIGLLKARTGAHEVITTIMSNYIAGFLALWMLKTDAFKPSGSLNPISKTVSAEARLPKLLGWIDGGLRVDIGFLIAIAAAVGMWWLFRKSKLGFELRTVGTNADAARVRRHEDRHAHRHRAGVVRRPRRSRRGDQGARHDAAGIGDRSPATSASTPSPSPCSDGTRRAASCSRPSCSARWRRARRRCSSTPTCRSTSCS